MATMVAKSFRESEKTEPLLTAKQALAGALAGATTSLILHPLDTAKTFRQTDPKRYTGVLKTLRLIAAERGFTSLYCGLLPAMLGTAPSSAVYFSTYELSKRTLGRLNDELDAGIARVSVNMLAAAFGNVTSSALFVPKEVMKQRLQVGLGGSVPEAATILYREAGVRGFYSGYFSTLMRNIPSNALKFMLYEEIKHFILFHSDSADLSTKQHLLAGGLAGLLSSFVTTPMDVMKTKYATGKAANLNIAGLASKILREEGVRGLFVGLRPRLMWSALFASIGLTCYETFKKLLTGDQSRWTVKRITRTPASRKCAFQPQVVPVNAKFCLARKCVIE
ncbi:hypothetical protein NDN08_000408 [Rhodosorus marinus]|uniref:Mitochondrial carrier protein n=1 Tax=Rhodosorus marinus TaxID=101924 RepID=A0AAV8UMS8_9RHOD|nr:hypothetical protein NDN08_000408 [Rhodosorus marinus]